MKWPFEKDKLVSQLPKLNWAQPQPLSQQGEAYARHYGIDFQNTLEGIAHGHGQVEVGEYRINTHVYYPQNPKGTILIVHGYYDHVGLFRHIMRHVLERGYALVAYDLPGHGLSSGEQVSISDFAIYQQVLDHLLAEKKQHMPKPWYVIAQSTGAAVIIDHLLNKNEQSPFEKSILLAPLVRPVNWKMNRLLYYVLRPFSKQVKRKVSDSSSDKDFLKLVSAGDPLQSAFLSVQWVGALIRWIPRIEKANYRAPYSPVIIQGTNDKTVDWKHNMKVLQARFTEPKIHYLEGARHHLANENKEYRRRILDILDEYIPN